MDKIAWIGLGTMGIPMAKNLAAAGFSVTAYNRTAKDMDVGACQQVATVQEAVSGARTVIVMVSDGAAVRDVLFADNGAVKWMDKGTLVVNMSTIGVAESKQLALDLANHEIEWMDAPVSGSVKPAMDKTLVVLAGGSEVAFEKMKPVFAAMSKSAHYLGPIGNGAAMKLLVNGYLGMVVESAAECIAVADRSGLGREAFLNVLSETGMWSPILSLKREAWLADDYPAAFALKHMTKDLGLMSDYARQLSSGPPALMTVLATYLAAQANGHAEEDMAAIVRQVSKWVGNG
jgi:3-hydroxyisobutyrate dehydrogenase-like beta-hydroxyacid dehydrogenase